MQHFSQTAMEMLYIYNIIIDVHHNGAAVQTPIEKTASKYLKPCRSDRRMLRRGLYVQIKTFSEAVIKCIT